MTYTIKCRARVSERCLHDQPTAKAFGEDLPLSEDGTFAPPTREEAQQGLPGTIICDPCYITLMPHTPSGKGLHHELDEAIAKVREVQPGVRDIIREHGL